MPFTAVFRRRLRYGARNPLCTDFGFVRYIVRGRCDTSIPLVPLVPPPPLTAGAFSQAFSSAFDVGTSP